MGTDTVGEMQLEEGNGTRFKLKKDFVPPTQTETLQKED